MLFSASSHPFCFVFVVPTRLFTSEPQPARADTKEALTGYYVTIHHFFCRGNLGTRFEFHDLREMATPASFESWSSSWWIRVTFFCSLTLSLIFSLLFVSKREKWKKRKTHICKKKHARGSHGNKNYLLQSVSWTIKVPTRILYRSCASRRWTTRLLAKSPPSPRT